ncbi:hypothetical protein AMJ86_03755 [bacterium SM23_57]|nr:MAG: hypothetical protein AMJ86_03755 [bacterium SM23_57]
MILRTLLFLVALYLILYLLAKSLGAFFRQVGQSKPKPKMPKTKEQPVLHIRKEDVEDAEFEDIPEDKKNKED